MKKLIIALLIITLIFSLSACQTYLFGKYINEERGSVYEFQTNNFSLTTGDDSISGTYEIKKGNITFKYDDIEITYSYSRNGTDLLIDNQVYQREN